MAPSSLQSDKAMWRTFFRSRNFFCAWRFFWRQASDLCTFLPLPLPLEGRLCEGLLTAAVLSSASSDSEPDVKLPVAHNGNQQ